jgi:hypothetical protein
MKIAAFLMMVAGLAIMLASLPLLASSTSRVVFVVTGLGIEIFGLVLVARAHLVSEEETG